MNIAVINIKDVFKFALKVGLAVVLIYFSMNILKGVKVSKQDKFKKGIVKETNKISKKSYVEVLDISMPLFSYKNKSNDNAKVKLFSNKDILSMESVIFDKSIFDKTDLEINKDELTVDDAEEVEKQIEELPKDAVIEAVDENNIIPKYTTSYKDVKINNQSDYEMTEEILEPNVEITNKKDILIYHTHTCESYTPSTRI